MPDPCWLPPKYEFSGTWGDLLDLFYGRFLEDIVHYDLRFRGTRVGVRKHPPTDGKEFGFWHCISEGSLEEDRIPDVERCKRIGWIRAVIENWDDPLVDYWVEERKGKIDHILWFREEYLIVLGERGNRRSGEVQYYLLKTACCTTCEHQKEKKRKARKRAAE